MHKYPGITPKNKHIRAAWLTLPKIICWQIWLERNQRIFRDKKNDFKIVLVKIKSQLKDSLGDQLDGADLSEHDSKWIAMLDLNFKVIVRPPTSLKDWQIRVNTT